MTNYHINSTGHISVCNSNGNCRIKGYSPIFKSKKEAYEYYEETLELRRLKERMDRELRLQREQYLKEHPEQRRQARQQHGFKYEKLVTDRYGIIKKPEDHGYTAPWDGHLGDIPVSIKTAKYGAGLGMSDIFRNASKTEDFYLIFSFWQGIPDNLVYENVYKIPADYWRSQFDDYAIQQYRHAFDGITHSHADDAKWTERMNSLKELWPKDSIIVPNFKRDHKGQQRVQCTLKHAAIIDGLLDKYIVELPRIE